MKFTKMKANPLVGRVRNEETNEVMGIYGEVSALMEMNILEECTCPRTSWIFIPGNTCYTGRAEPQDSKDDLIEHLKTTLST